MWKNWNFYVNPNKIRANNLPWTLSLSNCYFSKHQDTFRFTKVSSYIYTSDAYFLFGSKEFFFFSETIEKGAIWTKKGKVFYPVPVKLLKGISWFIYERDLIISSTLNLARIIGLGKSNITSCYHRFWKASCKWNCCPLFLLNATMVNSIFPLCFQWTKNTPLLSSVCMCFLLVCLPFFLFSCIDSFFRSRKFARSQRTQG